MQIARLLVFTLLMTMVVISPVLVHSQLPVEVLTETHAEISSANISPAVMPMVSLLEAPVSQKPKVNVVDKKFIAVMAALGGAETLRFATHKLVLDHEYAAGAPWVTSVPPNRRLVAKFGAIYAVELLVAYELKKPHSWLPGDKIIRKFWWAYPAAMAPIHIKNGVRSIRTQPPSCPVEECQMP